MLFELLFATIWRRWALLITFRFGTFCSFSTLKFVDCLLLYATGGDRLIVGAVVGRFEFCGVFNLLRATLRPSFSEAIDRDLDDETNGVLGVICEGVGGCIFTDNVALDEALEILRCGPRAAIITNNNQNSIMV